MSTDADFQVTRRNSDNVTTLGDEDIENYNDSWDVKYEHEVIQQSEHVVVQESKSESESESESVSVSGCVTKNKNYSISLFLFGFTLTLLLACGVYYYIYYFGNGKKDDDIIELNEKFSVTNNSPFSINEDAVAVVSFQINYSGRQNITIDTSTSFHMLCCDGYQLMHKNESLPSNITHTMNLTADIDSCSVRGWCQFDYNVSDTNSNSIGSFSAISNVTTFKLSESVHFINTSTITNILSGNGNGDTNSNTNTVDWGCNDTALWTLEI